MNTLEMLLSTKFDTAFEILSDAGLPTAASVSFIRTCLEAGWPVEESCINLVKVTEMDCS